MPSRPSRLYVVSLNGDDSLCAEARDAAFDKALHDHRVRERRGLGSIEPKLREDRHTVSVLFLPRHNRSFQPERAPETCSGALARSR
jgi:hypothetical protein